MNQQVASPPLAPPVDPVAIDASGEMDIEQRLRRMLKADQTVLPLPGSGQTLERWRALAGVAAVDLSLAKLFESHTDALAIMAELAPTSPLTQASGQYGRPNRPMLGCRQNPAELVSCA